MLVLICPPKGSAKTAHISAAGAVRRRASKAATRIACVIVGYKADDLPAKRRAAIQRMRAHWQKEKDSARQYWTMILKNRQAKETP